MMKLVWRQWISLFFKVKILKNKRILLITKNYPPQIGGIETYVISLAEKLKTNNCNIRIINAPPRNTFLLLKSDLNLIWKILYIFSEFSRFSIFLLKIIFVGIPLSLFADIIWCTDWTLAPFGFFLSKISYSNSYLTLHWKEVVWGNIFYQKIIAFFWHRTDKIFIVNKNIYESFLSKKHSFHGTIIYSPHSLEFYWKKRRRHSFTRESLFNQLNIPAHFIDNRIFLLSIGRFIPRKGFHWFLERVFSAVNQDHFYYIIVWSGPMYYAYDKIVQKYWLKNKVFILQNINDDLKNQLLSSADYFIMPNIEIKNDIEGFGLVLIEAHSHWIPIICSDADNIDKNIDVFKSLPQEKSEIWIDFLNLL